MWLSFREYFRLFINPSMTVRNKRIGGLTMQRYVEACVQSVNYCHFDVFVPFSSTSLGTRNQPATLRIKNTGAMVTVAHAMIVTALSIFQRSLCATKCGDFLYVIYVPYQVRMSTAEGCHESAFSRYDWRNEETPKTTTAMDSNRVEWIVHVQPQNRVCSSYIGYRRAAADDERHIRLNYVAASAGGDHA